MTPRPPKPGLRLGPTISYPTSEPAVESRPRPRCRFARGSTPATESGGELRCLLHTRLRLASLITAGPMLFFLIKNYFDPGHDYPTLTPHLVQAGVTAITLLLTVYIWLRRAPEWRELRIYEVVLFGTVAGFFAWLQYLTVATDAFCGPVPATVQGPMLHLLTLANALRWFFLIVVYGVYIPNTWRRCAVVAAATAILPMVLTVLFASWRNWMGGELLSALSDTAVIMLIAVSVAVFGSYRIHVLQQQASEARQLGQYRLKRLLGAGGMGEVYLAEHTLLRRPCAVKLILPEQTLDPTNLQRFEREVRAMATLTHWNTVEVFDYGHAEDGTFYYVMEYLPGKNLETLVERYGRLPPARVIHFLRQVCRALREAHGVGILHRDVKPSNIIACERGGVFDVAKLLDFGLVQTTGLGKDAEKLTVVGSVVGSPPYMAPEQATGREDLDGRSDIYGVGGVAYFLLTGVPPFVKDTAMEMMLAHAYEAPRPPSELRPDIPRDLEEVILRCLKKRPDDRYRDANSLEKALAACGDAGGWTEEDAAAWWGGARSQETPGTDAALPVPTVKAPTTA
ncbi:MAG TPA: serine/threonine-protein kinase [Gemmataceae bacterium]|nr:serine/threonine-protein kinase [Gemmataceae bacterium]